MAAYEDTFYYAWRERRLPVNVDPFDSKIEDPIERKRDEARQKAVPDTPFPPPRIELWACGENWRVYVAGGDGRGRVSVIGPGLLALSGDAHNKHSMRLLLRRWLMERAREFLTPALEECARELGFDFERILIRRQRTRWGSCSANRHISINARLLMVEPKIAEYVLIHELCHTKEMNHSPRFWKLVERHEPDYRRLDRALTIAARQMPWWANA